MDSYICILVFILVLCKIVKKKILIKYKVGKLVKWLKEGISGKKKIIYNV